MLRFASHCRLGRQSLSKKARSCRKVQSSRRKVQSSCGVMGQELRRRPPKGSGPLGQVSMMHHV